MPSELYLIVSDDTDQEKTIPVNAGSFSLGRGAGNDLALSDAGLSRRHALITFLSSGAQITDCNSANGTFVNGQRITDNASLQNGDVITLGQNCRIRVQLTAAVPPPNPVITPAPSVKAGTNNFSLPPFYPQQSHALPVTPTPKKQFFRSALTLALVAMTGILLVASIAIIYFYHYEPPRMSTSFDPPTPTVTPSVTNVLRLGSTPTVTPSIPPPEKSAVQVIRKICDQDDYPFAPEILHEINNRAAQYPSATIASAVQSLRANQELAKMARDDNIKPELAVYLGLAETNGGQQGNVVAVAKQALQALKFYRVQYGVETADKTLLVLAAYKMAAGAKKLDACLRTNASNNPKANRNVWYLHQKGCVTTDAYDFVIRFLACGVLAQKIP